MKKHRSEEALYARMRQLAEVNKPTMKESHNLGELIDVKRSVDGVAYGIVRENHHYYIKKGGLNENLTAADFAYIGGTANITEFQYKKLSEAEKQRNMLLHIINESLSTKMSKTGSKILKEDKAGEEIDAAASKVADLEAATDAAEVPAEPVAPEGEAEMDAGLEAMPQDGIEAGAEDMGAGDIEAGGDEMAAAGDEEEVAVGDPETETEREIEKNLGKITNQLRKTELTDSQVKSYVNTFLSAFKDKFPDVDIEDRKKMAEKITKVVPPEEIEDLGTNVEATEPSEDELEEETCNECGTFAQYAESRGYTAESIQECGEEEMTNLVSGYANAHGDGMNDGDFKAVALFITPEIIEKLKGDYGHEDYASEVEPFSQEMNEEDKSTQIAELFGGLKNLGKSGLQAAGQKVKQVGQKIGQAAQNVKQTYHAGELSGEVKKVEQAAAQLGAQISSLNKRMQKAGGQPINVGSIMTTIKNQITKGGAASLGQYSTVQEEGIPVDSTEVQPMQEDINFSVNDKKGKPLSADNVPVKELKEEEEIDINTLDVSENMSLSSGFDNMGVGVAKPTDAPVEIKESKEKPSTGLSKEKKSDVVKSAKKGEDIGKKGKGFEKVADKAAKEYGSKEKGEKVAAAAMWKNIKREGKEEKPVMSESEKKLRLYIRKRLEEHAGIRKPSLNEGVKSEALQKLDRIIDKQFGLYESKAKEQVNESINEVFGFSIPERFAKLDPNDAAGIEKLFAQAFNDILKNPKMGIIGRAARTTPPEVKYNILQQYVQGNGGTLRLADMNTVQFAPKSVKDQATKTPFAGGGTGGNFAYGGTTGTNENLNEIFGLSVAEKFAKLNPNDTMSVEKLFKQAFTEILSNPKMGVINRAAKTTPIQVKYDILKQYVEGKGGTLRLGDMNTVKYAPESVKVKSMENPFGGGGTGGGNFAYGGSTGT